MNEREPIARLAEALATALREFAAGTDNATAAGPAAPTDPAAEAIVVTEQPPRPADEHALGKRQRQIVEVPGLTDEVGLKTADIAAAIDYEVPNTYTALQALARFQVVEQVPGKEPQHWRLVRRYRATNREYARLAGLLGPEEWATPADISIAVRGDIHAADAIAKAGLSDRIADSAPPGARSRVSWDDLRRRAATTPRRRQTMATGVLNYVQIPATDLETSITFYEEVFGWTVRRQPTAGGELEQTSYPEFSDSTGRNGGGFVLDRPPSREPGLLPCIAVESIDETLTAVLAHGGEVVQPKTAIVEGVDWEAVFRDPAGNAFGLFEEAPRAPGHDAD